jgi:hypothetical protein
MVVTHGSAIWSPVMGLVVVGAEHRPSANRVGLQALLPCTVHSTLSPPADSRRMVYMWLPERPEIAKSSRHAGRHDEQTEPARARSG